MLKKLSVNTEDYSLNVDINGSEVAIINLQSIRDEDDVNGVDVAEIIANREEIEEMIRMLEHARNLLE